MRTFRAIVLNGRLRLGAPTDLPEGWVVDLKFADEDDERRVDDKLVLAEVVKEWVEHIFAGRELDKSFVDRLDRARAAVKAWQEPRKKGAERRDLADAPPRRR